MNTIKSHTCPVRFALLDVEDLDDGDEDVSTESSTGSDSSLQFDTDNENHGEVSAWENFDILKVLLDEQILEKGFDPKVGGFYRRTKEHRNGNPVWKNRFHYKISKLDHEYKVFDLHFPHCGSVMRIEEDTYHIWVLGEDNKFYHINDNSVQFFFEYMQHVELDHFIESFFHAEHKNTVRLTPTAYNPRGVDDSRWSIAHASNNKASDRDMNDDNEKSEGEDEELPILPLINPVSAPPAFQISVRSDPGAAASPVSFFRQSTNSDFLPPLHRQNSAKETFAVKRKRRGEKVFINQYMVERTLAATGQGKVKLATDIIHNEKVVLKIFERALLSKREKFYRPFGKSKGKQQVSLLQKTLKPKRTVMDNIKREMEIMKDLHHPNIVSALEIIDDPDSEDIFLVLEYVEGGTLSQFLGAENSIPLCRSFSRDILKGLEYLHQKRIIHGDIKPDNILVKIIDGRKCLKLADFGVSKTISECNSFMSKIETTPAYQAPEEFGNANFKAWPRDIWGVSVVLHQLVFGVNPFTPKPGAALHETFERIVKHKIQLPAECDPNLADLLYKMLKKNPIERIDLGRIKKHTWITDHGKYEWNEAVPQEEEVTDKFDEETEDFFHHDMEESHISEHWMHSEVSNQGKSFSDLVANDEKKERRTQLKQMRRLELIDLVLELESEIRTLRAVE